MRLSKKKLLLATDKEIMESNEKNGQQPSTSASKKRHRDRPSAAEHTGADFRNNTQAISIFLEKCQRYSHEGRPDQISPWDIFLS